MSGQSSSGLVGTVVDMIARIRAVLPAAWFPITSPGLATSPAPVLDGVLSGIGWAWSYCYDLISYARSQARIATATGGFLDMICVDFFGLVVKRQPAEPDDAFRSRIRANLLLPRATRSALSGSVLALYGRAPFIFEPRRAADTGGYGAISQPVAGGGGGLGAPGLGYGSGTMPFQYLVTIPNSGSWSSRGSEASYIDGNGAMQMARPHVVRPLYALGVLQGALIEDRSFNLIKDSLGWSACLPAVAGSACQWVVDPSGDGAILTGQALLRISITGRGIISGPTMKVAPGFGAVTASAWMMLPTGHSLLSLGLKITDPADAANAVVEALDLTIVGKWQRISVSLPSPGREGRQVSMMLEGSSSGVTAPVLLTQCWQIEPGMSATSYIPSQNDLGVRDADGLQVLDSLPASVVDPVGLQQAVGRVIPAGSLAWMTVAG